MDRFGQSVSAYLRTVVVGAPGNDSNAGAAYVFVRQSATTWVQQAKLVPTFFGTPGNGSPETPDEAFVYPTPTC